MTIILISPILPIIPIKIPHPMLFTPIAAS